MGGKRRQMRVRSDGRWRVTAALGRLLLAGLALAASGGCYHAGSDALARAAQKSFREATEGGRLDEELKLSRDLLQAELKAARAETEAERDLALALALDDTWSAPLASAAAAPPPAPGAEGPAIPPCGVPGTDGMSAGSLLCDINRMLVRVGGRSKDGGSPLAALREVRARAARAAAETESVIAKDERSLRLLLPASGAARLGCPESGPPDAAAIAERPGLKPLFDAYAASCARLQQARNYLAAPPTEGGLLAATQGELNRSRALLEQQRAEADRLKAEFDKAQAESARAGARGELGGEIDKARAALDKLASAGRAADGALGNRYALLAETMARYQAVQAAIDAGLSGGTPLGSGAAGWLGGLAVVVRTASELEELQHDPSVLLLEAERLRGQVALLRVQIDHAERQVALLDGRRRALLDELGELLSAGDAAEEAMRRCKARGGDQVGETFRAAREPLCRNAVAQTLLHYANAWTVGELRARLAGKRADGDLQDSSIEGSAAAMRVWEQVLAVPIDAVVRRHASGIKPEELARLIVEAIGAGALVGIAVPK